MNSPLTLSSAPMTPVHEMAVVLYKIPSVCQAKTKKGAAHGGGRRCSQEGCGKSAQGATDFCKAHGGGRRCSQEGCGKSAQGATDFCAPCKKKPQGSTGLCKVHQLLEPISTLEPLEEGEITQDDQQVAQDHPEPLEEGEIPEEPQGCSAFLQRKKVLCGKPTKRDGLCSDHLRAQAVAQGEPTDEKASEPCQVIIKSGGRKGQVCGRKTASGSDCCSYHKSRPTKEPATRCVALFLNKQKVQVQCSKNAKAGEELCGIHLKKILAHVIVYKEEEEQKGCEAMITRGKRKGDQCAKKICKRSQKYCLAHSRKMDPKTPLNQEPEDQPQEEEAQEEMVPQESVAKKSNRIALDWTNPECSFEHHKSEIPMVLKDPIQPFDDATFGNLSVEFGDVKLKKQDKRIECIYLVLPEGQGLFTMADIHQALDYVLGYIPEECSLVYTGNGIRQV